MSDRALLHERPETEASSCEIVAYAYLVVKGKQECFC